MKNLAAVGFVMTAIGFLAGYGLRGLDATTSKPNGSEGFEGAHPTARPQVEGSRFVDRAVRGLVTPQADPDGPAVPPPSPISPEGLFRARQIESSAARTEPGLRSMFESFGLTDSQIQEVLDARRALHSDAIDAGSTRERLVQAKNDYDKAMRRTLTEEGYAKYRDYEGAKRAESTLNAILESPAAAGTQFSEVSKSKLVNLLESFSDTIRIGETWHRPYDPLPHPAGGIAGAEEFRREQILFSAGRTALLQEATPLFAAAEFKALERVLEEHASYLVEAERIFRMTPQELLKLRQDQQRMLDGVHP